MFLFCFNLRQSLDAKCKMDNHDATTMRAVANSQRTRNCANIECTGTQTHSLTDTVIIFCASSSLNNFHIKQQIQSARCEVNVCAVLFVPLSHFLSALGAICHINAMSTASVHHTACVCVCIDVYVSVRKPFNSHIFSK